MRMVKDTKIDVDAVVQRAYQEFVFTCPNCGHEAHLAESRRRGFLDGLDVG